MQNQCSHEREYISYDEASQKQIGHKIVSVSLVSDIIVVNFGECAANLFGENETPYCSRAGLLGGPIYNNVVLKQMGWI